MSHNNKNKTYKRKSNLITEYKTINNSSTLFPEVPYIKAGNIFFRNRCQFSKNKSINNNKRDFQRSKSCELLNINIKNRSFDRIKELEVENYHLKKMIRISEKKLNEKKKELEKILILQNIYNQNEKRKYDISPIPNMQFKKYKPPSFLWQPFMAAIVSSSAAVLGCRSSRSAAVLGRPLCSCQQPSMAALCPRQQPFLAALSVLVSSHQWLRSIPACGRSWPPPSFSSPLQSQSASPAPHPVQPSGHPLSRSASRPCVHTPHH